MMYDQAAYLEHLTKLIHDLSLRKRLGKKVEIQVELEVDEEAEEEDTRYEPRIP